MQSSTTEKPTARQQILGAAGELFYRDGFRAVGIDTIIAHSGVAKMTLYRHFSSKDDLIVAYLEHANQGFWGWFETALGTGDARAQLHALFESVQRLAASPHCLGCTFQSTAAEFPSLDHPGHRVALAHKEAVRTRLRDLAALAGLRDPQHLGDQLTLLMDGTWVAARMYGGAGPAASVAAAAHALLDAHTEASHV